MAARDLDDSVVIARQIDELCDQLERDWKTGEPNLKELTAEILDRNLPALLRELIPLDINCREKRGKFVRVSDYESLFPSQSHLVRSICQRFLEEDSDVSRLLGSKHHALRDPKDLPTSIGKYQVIEYLGSGGQADVFKAMHPHLHKEVVIKLGKETTVASVNDRLVKEGRLLTQLDHKHICRVLDLDFHEGKPFMVMDYIQGKTLREMNLSTRDGVTLLAKIASAVAFANSKGIIHQDIKPSNIIVDRKGEPHLIDFGLARIGGEEIDGVVGTVGYMPPELANQREDLVNSRTDVFGLGAVLHYLLVTRPPIEGDTFREAFERAKNGVQQFPLLDRITAPPILKDVCKKALNPDPGERFESATEFAKQLVQRKSKLPVQLLAAAVVIAICYGAFRLVDADLLTDKPSNSHVRQSSMPGDKPNTRSSIQQIVACITRSGGRIIRYDGSEIAEPKNVSVLEGFAFKPESEAHADELAALLARERLELGYVQLHGDVTINLARALQKSIVHQVAFEGDKNTIRIDQQQLDDLIRLPGLRLLAFANCRFTGDAIKQADWSSASNLQDLFFNESPITNEDVRAAAKANGIKSLTVSGRGINDSFVRTLSHLRNFQGLHLSGSECQIGNEGVATLVRDHGATLVAFTGHTSDAISKENLLALGSCKNLSLFGVPSVPNFDDDVLDHWIANCPGIASVTLNEAKLTAQSIGRIAHWKRLNRLTMNHVTLDTQAQTKFIEAVQSLTDLEGLLIRDLKITREHEERFLTAIENLENLSALDVRATGLSGEAVSRLRQLNIPTLHVDR